MVNSDYAFIYIDASGKESASDAQLYNSSDLKEGMERNLIMGFPGSEPFSNDIQNLPFVIVGNDACSLSKARRVVENASTS